MADNTRRNPRQQRSHILINSCQFLQKRHKLLQFRVCQIWVPTCARQCIFGLKHVTVRAIVHNDNIWERSTKATQIFDKKLSIYMRAVLSIQSVVNEGVCRVNFVENWTCITAQRSCKSDYFVKLSQIWKEKVTPGSFVHENLVDELDTLFVWNVDFNDKIRMTFFFKLTVNKSLVKVKNQSFEALFLFGLRLK